MMRATLGEGNALPVVTGHGAPATKEVVSQFDSELDEEESRLSFQFVLNELPPPKHSIVAPISQAHRRCSGLGLRSEWGL